MVSSGLHMTATVSRYEWAHSDSATHQSIHTCQSNLVPSNMNSVLCSRYPDQGTLAQGTLALLQSEGCNNAARPTAQLSMFTFITGCVDFEQ